VFLVVYSIYLLVYRVYLVVYSIYLVVYIVYLVVYSVYFISALKLNFSNKYMIAANHWLNFKTLLFILYSPVLYTENVQFW